MTVLPVDSARQPVPEDAPGWPGRWHRLAASALLATVVALQLRAMIGPHEDWPFTSAPMFARYQAPGDPLVELRVLVVTEGRGEFELDAERDLGLGELGFRRQFFSQYYGSTDPEHPSRHYSKDGFAQHRQRVLDWMRKVARGVRRKRGQLPQRLRLEAVRVTGSERERHPLFEYLPATDVLVQPARPWWRETP